MADPALRSLPATSAVAKIESFFETPESTARFLSFIEEILRDELPLKEVLLRKHLHEGIRRFGFEYVGLDNKFVLLRVNGELVAVQIVPQEQAVLNAIVERPTTDSEKVLQVLWGEDYVEIWRERTKTPPDVDYNTVTSDTAFTDALISSEPQNWHGLQLVVESVLGSGLEGTVYLVREASLHEHFALKKSYKDLRAYCTYWKGGFARIRKREPHILPYLLEFYSCELVDSPAIESGEQQHFDGDPRAGSTLLMQYKPLTALTDVLHGLLAGERLRKGLRILSDVVRVVRKLWTYTLFHGDVGVSNVFVYPTVGGGAHAVLIDPHPEVAESSGRPKAHFRRKDLFGLLHILYWLVTNEQWPEGAYDYMQQFVSGEHDPREGRQIFSAPPLSDDFEYRMLHGAAVGALGSKKDEVRQIALELILERAKC